MDIKPGEPVLPFATADDWGAWLTTHHASAASIWLKLAKKDSGIASVTYSEAVEVALCHGWIDGQMRGFDQSHFVQRFTPRRGRSRWSKVNRERAEALIAAGRMRPAGQEEIDRARADGRWDAAYASPRTAVVPDDLQAALDGNPAALAFFATLTSANRYAILYQVEEAKRPETRARRIDKYVAMLVARRTVHPQSPPRSGEV